MKNKLEKIVSENIDTISYGTIYFTDGSYEHFNKNDLCMNNTNTLKDKCISMVGFNTTTNIITITIEELSELIQSLSKLSRYREHDDTLRTTRSIMFNNLLEELADVYLMLEQIKYIYFIEDKDIEEMITKKIERTLNKLQPK